MFMFRRMVERWYQVVKMIIGLTSLLNSFMYFTYTIDHPGTQFYYLPHVVAWIVFSAIMIGEGFVKFTEPR